MAFQMQSEIPEELSYQDVVLRYEKTVPGDPAAGFVPFHHFKIITNDEIAGHINFKVGDTRHILMVAGHIGYEVRPEFRGRSLSYKACMAIAPFVRRIYKTVMVTVDPGNIASIRIIDKLGARFIDEIDIPEDDPAYRKGLRRKRRYEWEP